MKAVVAELLFSQEVWLHFAEGIAYFGNGTFRLVVGAEYKIKGYGIKIIAQDIEVGEQHYFLSAVIKSVLPEIGNDVFFC